MKFFGEQEQETNTIKFENATESPIRLIAFYYNR